MGHALSVVPLRETHYCDVCGRTVTAFSCSRCDYDVCQLCWDAWVSSPVP